VTRPLMNRGSTEPARPPSIRTVLVAREEMTKAWWTQLTNLDPVTDACALLPGRIGWIPSGVLVGGVGFVVVETVPLRNH
jgi:hypothetical protein